MPNAFDVLLTDLAARPGPVLTWYSTSGERIDLTGRVFAQWIAKCSHLLTDLDLQPGERVLVDLGPDWRAPLVWFAAWRNGLTVTDGAPASAVVARADRRTAMTGVVTGDALVVVPVASLARRVDPLPTGATDFAAAVPAFPDQPAPAADLSGPALVLAGRSWTGTEVLASSTRRGRELVGPEASARDLLAIWSGGGSVVWHDGLDATTVARVTETESVG